MLRQRYFDVAVTFGNQSFTRLLDTGSSDLWVLQTGYECINATDGSELSQPACLWGNATHEVPSTSEQIPDETFGVQYGGGEVATGIVGYGDVTLGDITIQRQEFGVVNVRSATGDGLESGVIGLGYPVLTSAHPGNNTLNATNLLLDRLQYAPLFQGMYEQDLVDPYFSLAPARLLTNVSSGNGGYLGLGSLPPIAHNSSFVSAPVEIYNGIPAASTNGTSQISEWAITVGGVSYGANGSLSTNSTPFQVIIDSGNYFNFFPIEVADAVNAQFDPPASPPLASAGAGVLYPVACDAKPPSIGVIISNQTFYHNSLDLILPIRDVTCVSAIGSTTETEGVTLHFLADSFLKNVVAVFDFGANEMRFAARSDASNATGVPASTGSGSLYRANTGLIVVVLAMALIL